MCPGNARKVFVDCRNVEHFAVVAFFLRGEFSLRNLRTGQQKRMLLLFFYRYQEQIKYRMSTDSAAHVKTQDENVSYRLNGHFGQVFGGLVR